MSNNFKSVRRKRFPRAMRSEFTVSSTDMTGLMPFLPETEEEEKAFLQMYPTHKTHRD